MEKTRVHVRTIDKNCADITYETDAFVQEVFRVACENNQVEGRIAVLAVGGYGRCELAPFSDLDILLIHEKRKIDKAFLNSFWYPLWDSGRKIGHAVRTPK
ncbi:MAG: DUF294 nucleotidyltransferase-like domain-containing protein, partial [Ilumatobacteraceae bacterium]